MITCGAEPVMLLSKPPNSFMWKRVGNGWLERGQTDDCGNTLFEGCTKA